MLSAFLLLFLSHSIYAQCGGCSYTETELTTGGMSTIPAGTVVCITTNTCLGATSAYPATCSNAGSGTLTINGILRICPGVTFSFAGSINGTGRVQINSGGRFSLYGTYSCGVNVTAVDPDIATGTSTSTAVGGCNSSACEPHFADGYAPFGVVATGLGYTVSGSCAITGIPSNIVLPLQLLSWQAAWQGSAVVLTWTTPGKDQGAAFETEYSPDGAAWQPLSTIPGIANPPAARYSVLVTPAPANRNFFRLRYEDAVGQTSYSAVQELDAARDSADAVVAGPNPVHSLLTVHTATTRPYTLQVLDITGKPILRRLSNSSGEYDLSGLAAGIYFLQVTTASGASTVKKLTKL